MKREPRLPGWLVINLNTGALECQRCGAVGAMILPVLLSEMRKAFEPFATDHAKCKAKP